MTYGVILFVLAENFFGHNWRIRFKLIKGVCEGLSYLHDASIEHSDINLDNIFLDNKMVPKISDFGIFSLGVIIKRIVLSGVMDYVNIPDMEDQAFIEHVRICFFVLS